MHSASTLASKAQKKLTTLSHWLQSPCVFPCVFSLTSFCGSQAGESNQIRSGEGRILQRCVSHFHSLVEDYLEPRCIRQHHRPRCCSGRGMTCHVTIDTLYASCNLPLVFIHEIFESK